MAKMFELVFFITTSVKRENKLMEGLFRSPVVVLASLVQKGCLYYKAINIKDLSLLRRNLSQVIIIDDIPCRTSSDPSTPITGLKNVKSIVPSNYVMEIGNIFKMIPTRGVAEVRKAQDRGTKPCESLS